MKQSELPAHSSHSSSSLANPEPLVCLSYGTSLRTSVELVVSLQIVSLWENAAESLVLEVAFGFVGSSLPLGPFTFLFLPLLQRSRQTNLRGKFSIAGAKN